MSKWKNDAWAKTLKASGVRRLRLHKSSGRPSKLTAEVKKKLKRLMDRGALAAGFPTDRWTLVRVSELLKKEFDIDYHPNSLGPVLDQMGYSVQKPLPRAAERDEELVKAWLTHDWPRIKKLLQLGAIVVFFDAFGFSYLEPLATTWARKGKRPILRRVARDRRVLSTAVALTMSGKVYKRHFEGSIRSEQVIETIEHVQRNLPGKIILVWDRARTHKSKKTQVFLAAHPEIWVEELPAYAPELNPEEYCHGNVKHHLKNARPTNKIQIRQMLNRGFARLRHRPDLLLSFFHAAGLSVQQLQLT